MTTSPTLPVLLVVEDDEGLQRQLKWAYDGYHVVIAGDRASAIEALRVHEPAVVTLDLGLPPDPDGTEEGFATLIQMVRLKPDTKIIVASGHGARESALKAIASGAYDFYRKPVDIDELGLIVARAFHLHGIETENRRLEADGDAAVLGSMITAAPEMLKVAKTVERVATAGVSVMLLGASGTGKELLARAVHDQSGRSGGAFIAINCAAIPENLLESELFGYERGAFTGAVKSNVGKIELAAGGT
ncbi:MAG: sigma 54-interacting transcriptional regulator, partial [Sphingomicrobium sp.]